MRGRHKPGSAAGERHPHLLGVGGLDDGRVRLGQQVAFEFRLERLDGVDQRLADQLGRVPADPGRVVDHQTLVEQLGFRHPHPDDQVRDRQQATRLGLGPGGRLAPQQHRRPAPAAGLAAVEPPAVPPQLLLEPDGAVGPDHGGEGGLIRPGVGGLGDADADGRRVRHPDGHPPPVAVVPRPHDRLGPEPPAVPPEVHPDPAPVLPAPPLGGLDERVRDVLDQQVAEGRFEGLDLGRVGPVRGGCGRPGDDRWPAERGA
jgi:hypothetical protein